MNKFTSRLILVDSAILVSLFIVFFQVILSASQSASWQILLSYAPYFSLFDLYFLVVFLGMFILDRASSNHLRVEMLVFLLWAGLSGFELRRSGQFQFLYMANYGLLAVLPSLFMLLKGLVFLESGCLFYLLRLREAESTLDEKGELEGSLLYQNLLFWAAVAFILGLFVGPIFAPTSQIFF